MNEKLIKTTIEETVDELRLNLDESVTTLEAVLNNRKATQESRDAAQLTVDKTLKALNTRTMEDAFVKWANNPASILAALAQGYIANFRIKRTIENETKKVTLEIQEMERVADLCKFDDAYTGNGTLCENGQWRFMVEKFAKNICKRIANDLKAKGPENDFRMSDKAQKCEFSSTDLLKQLQMIVDAIIFVDNGKGENEFKALSHDVKYLLYSIPKRNRNARLSITMGGVKVVREVVTEICHRVVTNARYDVDYKRMEKKTTVKEMKKAA